MKGYIAFVAYGIACLAAIIALEALFAAWWEIDADEDPLPLMAAGAVVLGCVTLLLRHRIRSFHRFDMQWSRDHVIASSGILAAALFAFLLGWGLIVREPWRENLAWAVGGAAAVFAFMVFTGYVERLIQREARKRGIAVDNQRLGRFARSTAWALGVPIALFLLLGLLIELGVLGED